MSTYILSLATVTFAAYYNYVTFTPCRPASNEERRAAGNTQRSRVVIFRYSAHILNTIHSIHFIIEMYGIYLAGTSQLSSIHPWSCPPKTSNIGSVYQPNGSMSATFALACVAMVIGGSIRTMCYNALGHMFRWEVSIQKAHKLITTGPYSFVRHPSYTGMLFATVGVVGVTFARGTVLQECVVHSYEWVSPLVWFLAIYRVWVASWLSYRTIEEDQLLKKEFGAEWDKWATKTRYRLIPYVF